MPSSLVQHQYRMPAWRYGLADCFQVKCHRPGIGKGQHEANCRIALRAHGAKDISRLRLLLPHDAGSCSLDGLVTNDKFCVTRFACLTLAPSRYKGWRQRAPDSSDYPSAKVGFCGGCDETPLEHSSPDDCGARRATALGSGVPNAIGMDPLCDGHPNFAGTGEA
jgi:hypothetical protein